MTISRESKWRKRLRLCPVWSVLVWAALQIPATAALASRPKWVKQVGTYRLVKWSRPSPTDTLESIVIRDGKGRQVARVTNHYVNVELIRDLTNDGWPEVVIRAADMGAHGPAYYYIYSLARKPRCLLAYLKNNIDDGPDSPDFKPHDLDGDGRQEILTWYDGFAYWLGGGDDWLSSFAGAARVPVVLGFRHGRYADVTPQYRRWLRAKLAQAKRHLLKEVDEAGGEKLLPDPAQSIIEYYAIALMLSKPAFARRQLLELLPRQERAAFLKIHRPVAGIVAARYRRYAYPPAYGSTVVFKPLRWVYGFPWAALPPDR